VFELGTCPDFIALSYTWGPPTATLPVKIQQTDSTNPWNQLIQVRANLWHFLNLKTKEYLDRYFWIDQISIDQTNNLEKNHQVRFMGEIFSRASLVLAWLGPLEEWSSDYAALEYLNEGKWNLDRKHPRQSPPRDFAASFLSFFDRPYWSRLWIVQELVLAQKVLFQCGHITLEWKHLHVISNAHDALQRLLKEEWSTNDGIKLYDWQLNFFLAVSGGQKSGPLYSVLQSFYGSVGIYAEHSYWQCEVLHDRIYALRGLIRAQERPEVDYSMPYEILCAESCVVILSKLRSNPASYIKTILDNVLVGLGAKWTDALLAQLQEIINKKDGKERSVLLKLVDDMEISTVEEIQ
jgi:hypothetical protein